jgi:hypothetical protein
MKSFVHNCRTNANQQPKEQFNKISGSSRNFERSFEEVLLFPLNVTYVILA